MSLRDNTPIHLFHRVRFSFIFYPDSRHPEGRSCTLFRRTISAYLKSIRDSARCSMREYTCEFTCAAREDTYAEIGRNSGRSQRQYIIEIYKFSSTPALEKRSGCCGGDGGGVAPLKRRARAERRLFLPFWLVKFSRGHHWFYPPRALSAALIPPSARRAPFSTSTSHRSPVLSTQNND